jgi:hypothetical protein
MFAAQNLGQGFAASTMMLLSVAIISSPGPISNSEARSVADPNHRHAVAGTSAIADDLAGPRGAARAATCLAAQHHALRHADRGGGLLPAARST